MTKQQTKVWSRKGKCPSCNVSTGSRHRKQCTFIYDKFSKIKKDKNIKITKWDKTYITFSLGIIMGFVLGIFY